MLSNTPSRHKTPRIPTSPGGTPALYEINYTGCPTPWFTIPASALRGFLQAPLEGLEYRPLYRGASVKAHESGDRVDFDQFAEVRKLAKTLRYLASQATRGPWAIHSSALDANGITEVFFIAEKGVRSEEDIFAETLDGNHDGAANAAYIAAANPEAITLMCATLEKLIPAQP